MTKKRHNVFLLIGFFIYFYYIFFVDINAILFVFETIFIFYIQIFYPSSVLWNNQRLHPMRQKSFFVQLIIKLYLFLPSKFKQKLLFFRF